MFKKSITILPVSLVTGILFYAGYFKQYQSDAEGLISVLFMIICFYVWVLIDLFRRRQRTVVNIIIQASFYVYAFCVLALTGYFLLFYHVASIGWWPDLLRRVDTLYGINVHVLAFLKEYHWWSNYFFVGNSIMLFPLGFYLPWLYKKIRSLLSVTLIAMVVSCSIELMQLISGFRITDIDDVIQNTAGASVGYMCFLAISLCFNSGHSPWLLNSKIQAGK